MFLVKKMGGLFGSAASSSSPPVTLTGYAMPWHPGMSGDGKLVPYVTYTDPGIAIGFQKEALSENQIGTFFGDGVDLKVFYAIPDKAGAEVIATSQALAKSDEFFQPSDVSNALMQGYLNYVAEALNLIYQTDTGGKLINGIIATKATVLIVIQVAYMGNSYNGGGVTTVVSAANQLIEQFPKDTLNANLLLDLIKGTSGKTDPMEACTWLAAQVNALPLLSLFVQDPQYTDGGFLGQFLRFKGATVTGKVINDWLTNADAGAFLAFLKTDKSKRDEVVLVDYFKSALIMILYGRSTPGASSNTTVQFTVCYFPKDDNDPVKQRPPAIGLGHELIHAYNVACGAQSGLEIYHFSTVLTERLCVGLPPFNDVAIHENRLRTDWPTVAARASVGFDRNAPGLRLCYDPTPEGDLLKTRSRASTP
jgi:hypothetical protein